MIEDHERVRHHEHHLRDSKLIRRWLTNRRLEKPHRIVREISNCTPRKHRKGLVLNWFVLGHDSFEFIKGIVLNLEGPRLASFPNRYFSVATRKNHPRPTPEKRIAPDLIALLCGLEEKTILPFVQLPKC